MKLNGTERAEESAKGHGYLLNAVNRNKKKGLELYAAFTVEKRSLRWCLSYHNKASTPDLKAKTKVKAFKVIVLYCKYFNFLK